MSSPPAQEIELKIKGDHIALEKFCDRLNSIPYTWSFLYYVRSRNRRMRGIPRTEYRYEPEIIEDEPIEVLLTCSQCDHFRVWGGCALTNFKRQSIDIACVQIKVSCPF